MKNTLTFLILIINCSIFSASGIMPDYPDSWNLIKKEKDTTIEKGVVNIKIIVTQLFSKKKAYANTEITFNTSYLMGKTDSFGVLNIIAKPSRYKMCADTPLGNGITKHFTLEDQTSYIFEIKMRLKKEKVHHYKRNEMRPEKPVIYLYPKRKQKVSVKVFPKGELSFTYPKYIEDEGWSVVAKPNGKIEYKNKTYNYLFWEGIEYSIGDIKKNNGFEVDSDTIVSFLENTLSKVGLTTEEQADFITYWAPKLEESQLNYIQFFF